MDTTAFSIVNVFHIRAGHTSELDTPRTHIRAGHGPAFPEQDASCTMQPSVSAQRVSLTVMNSGITTVLRTQNSPWVELEPFSRTNPVQKALI